MSLYDINERVIGLEAAGKKIIKFNKGDPDQPTDPRIVAAAVKAMKAGKTKYGSAAGEKDLREALADSHGVKAANIVITPGSKWAVFALMWLLLKRGGNTLIPSPHWTSFDLLAKEIGAEPRIVSTTMDKKWQPDKDALSSATDEDTKLIVINSPNNPTSVVYDRATTKTLADVAADKKIPVLADECYADICWQRYADIKDFSENVIVVRSFSKTFAMTGWRVGYAILPKDLAEKFTRLNQITITNIPGFVQAAALKALELRSEIAKKMRSVYKKRADVVCKTLSKAGLKFARPGAPFYVFPDSGTNSERLAEHLLQHGVAIVPGTSFGNYRTFFRLALTLPDAEIKEGARKLVAALREARHESG